ncbi:MAG: hypothetical protein PF570_07215 [Candidatus Cloacimonetes bacterium]|jgi:hypothetical protein|nr:hypothetical protein [Candidatus Cloacimonadota bacterium]
MKKLMLILFFVSTVFISLLDSIQILTNNWDKAQGYPLYEQVNKKEFTDTEEKYYKRKIQGFSETPEINYKFEPETRRNPQTNIEENYITFKDDNGSVLWTMESSIGTSDEYGASRTFYGSSSGITAIRDYVNSIFWVDKHGNELNRLELEDKQTAYITTLKDGEIWLIQTEYNSWDYSELRETPNLASLIFCDRTGNILNTIDLKYANLHNEKKLSKSEDYIMFSCYKNEYRPNQVWQQHHSYIIKYDGSILKEYEDDGVWLMNGSFSENEDIYVTNGGTDFIIDLQTGDIVSSYKTHGRSAIANKETQIVAVLDFYALRIINYKTKKLLFHKKFDVYPKPQYLEITGDGKEVIVVTKDHLYTFRMKE